jgi:SsrA-binding protein
MRKIYASNKKAFHDYNILERYETGIELMGSEVKAIRMSRINLKDSFARIINLEVFAFGIHITHLESAQLIYRPSEKRDRKLLMHKKEIRKLEQRVKTEGLALVPISVYANEKNKIKMELGLGKGKQLHDKRESLKERQADIETKRAIRDYS